jgi:GH25 family lysozyme M1 (1,4-beta-N-acetylmuramidase)
MQVRVDQASKLRNLGPCARRFVVIKGIDVSAIQGAIDWAAVKASDVRFVYVKATEGTGGVDSRFKTNVAGAMAAGVDGVGAYHFCKPSLSFGMASAKQDAQAEVAKFATTCNTLGNRAGELPPALDIEIFDGQTPGRVAEWIVTAVDEVRNTWGRSPVIYTGMPMAAALKLAPELASLDLWIPAYPQSKNAATGKWSAAISWESAAKRKPPKVLPWTAPTIWQFSGGDSSIPGNIVAGIKGWVDCNLYLRGNADFAAFCGRAPCG